MQLDLVYSDDFKSEPTVIFSGETTPLVEFAKILRLLPTGRTVRLHLESLFNCHNIESLELTIEENSLGMKQVKPMNFRWVISREAAASYAHLVEVLAQSKSAAHQYLDLENSEQIQIVVSKGEYPLGYFT